MAVAPGVPPVEVRAPVFKSVPAATVPVKASPPTAVVELPVAFAALPIATVSLAPPATAALPQASAVTPLLVAPPTVPSLS